jgi:hypothetical protein
MARIVLREPTFPAVFLEARITKQFDRRLGWPGWRR